MRPPLNFLICAFLLITVFLSAQSPNYATNISASNKVLRGQFLLATKDNHALLFTNPENQNIPHNYHGENSIIKLDNTGTLMWIKRYDFFDGSANDSIAKFIDATNSLDSSFVVIGNSGRKTQNYYYGNGFCIKLKKNGDTLWCRKITDTSSLFLHPVSIQTTIDSGYIICGSAIKSMTSNSMFSKAFILKLTKHGVISWMKTETGNSNSNAASVKQLPDSSYIMIGKESTTSSGGTEIWKFSKSGSLVWSKIYCSPSSSNCSEGLDVELDANGFVCLAKTSNIQLFKINFSGTFIWAKEYQSVSAYSGQQWRFAKLSKVSGGKYLVALNGSPTALVVDTGGIATWAGEVPNHAPDKVTDVTQLQNKSFMFQFNEPKAGFKSPQSDPYKAIGIIVVDSLGSDEHEFCYFKSTPQPTNYILNQNNQNKSFQSGGFSSNIQPTVVPTSAFSGLGCLIIGNVHENQTTGFTIYPNPASNSIVIKFQQPPGKNLCVEIIDITGKSVLHQTLIDDFVSPNINLDGLPNGLYFLVLKKENITVEAKKFNLNK